LRGILYLKTVFESWIPGQKNCRLGFSGFRHFRGQINVLKSCQVKQRNCRAKFKLPCNKKIAMQKKLSSKTEKLSSKM